MLETIACALALTSLGISVVLASRLRDLSDRVRSIESRPPPPQAALPKPPSPLDGLRVAIALTQDHPHPVFATLLKERLLGEGAEIVPEAEADVLVRGAVVCNGYADVYFTADLAAQTPGAPLFTLVEKPPHGDRQGNLALELVTRLKAEWEKRSTRDERRAALRELGG